MLRRFSIKYGLVEAKIVFWGANPVEIHSFVQSVEANRYIAPESYESLSRLVLPMHFQFDKVYLNALIAPGNFGGRQGLHETLRNFDAITCFIDKTDDTSLLYSKIELEYLLSDDAAILQPIVILVRTPDASGTVNDPKLITEFELDDVIRESNGRVSIFAYSLSPTRFVGCKEAVHWLLGQI